MLASHSPSTLLDDIINELKLEYDSNVGIIEGDSVRQVPSTNVLLNLSKLLTNLSKELHNNEVMDSEILLSITKRLVKQEGTDEDSNGGEENDVEPEYQDDNAIEMNNSQVAKGTKRNLDIEETSESKRKKVDIDNKTVLIKQEKTDESERLNSADDPVPPEQTGHFTQDNDTRLKNPKSEFVTPQTLSATAISELGLFSEDTNGLETQGKEYLKKKYGVASYPENDLKHLLAGEIPNVDFSKTKAPSNQVQFTTFQSYIESYYRLFLNEDLKFLNEKHVIPPGFEKMNYDPDVSPYIIPKLGQFYADAWAEEDNTLANKLNSPAFQQPSLDTYKPKGSSEDLDEDKLSTEDISCGPLSSRLLSAILSIHETVEDTDEEDTKALASDNSNLDENIATDIKVEADFDSETNDFHSIEERLKRELKYIGIFMNLADEDDSKNKLSLNGRPIKTEPRPGSIIDNDNWIKNKEDDEVSAEIRYLQKQLKEASIRNRLNKRKLIPLVEEQIAYQEYCTILEDLDKQVDQAYIKRLKSKTKKKKPEKVELTPAQQQAMHTGLRSLLDKRRRWIESIGKLFKPPEIMKRVPHESVLQGEVIEDDVEDEGNDVTQQVMDTSDKTS